MRIDLTNCKNLTAKKAKIREEMVKILMPFLKEQFEEEEGDVLQVGTNEIAAVVALDEIDGFPLDACVVVKAEVKSWNEPNPDAKRKVDPYDRFEAAENYQITKK